MTCDSLVVSVEGNISQNGRGSVVPITSTLGITLCDCSTLESYVFFALLIVLISLRISHVIGFHAKGEN